MIPVRVPSEGPKDAKIFILGESPGRKEVQKGRPFIGESGDVLNDVLRAAGIPRKDVFVSNVIKILPPGGGHSAKAKAVKRAFFFDRAGNPTQAYLEGIVEAIQEIKEVKPNVVVTLGNYALWAMMQHEKILKWRGSILESVLIPGQKVIPAIHPAFFINARNMWHQLPLLEWDFQRIAKESLSPDIVVPEPEIITDPSPQEISDAVDRFTAGQLVTADTEWYGPNDLAYIGFSDSPDYAVVIPNWTMDAVRAYKSILSTAPTVMQNGSFDVVALHRQGIETGNFQHDTMIAWNSCWASLRKKGLDTLCSILTPHPFYKDQVEFVGKDDTRGQHYCGMDCVVTHEAWEKIFSEEFPTTNGQIGYGISMSVMPHFLEASKRGILIDDELRIKIRDAYIEKADEIENALSAMLGYTINCRSSKQVIRLVFDDLLPSYGIKRKKRTSNQEVLMDIAASCRKPELELILSSVIRVRQNRNIVSRYLHDGILDIDGRVRTNWNIAGTRSGRLSATIPWWPGLALQTVPMDARIIFIADPGNVFIGFDYDQAEARVVAVLTHDLDLLDDMETGIDIHIKLASQLPFGYTYDELVAMVKEKTDAGEDKDEVRERYQAKRTRHALNYVEGPGTFKLHMNREWLDTGIGITLNEAKTLRNSYLEISAGLEPWWREVRARMRSDGYIDNCFGRRRWSLGRITEDTHREFVSYEPQSTIADLCTQAIKKICDRMPEIKVDLHMHDGAYFQVPYDLREEAYEIMMEECTWPIRIKNKEILIPATGKMGYSWGELGKPF